MNAQRAGWYADPHDQAQLRYWNGSAWTEHRSPKHGGPTPAQDGPTGRWYFVITLASLGLLAAVPFFHAASRLDRPQTRKVGTAIAAVSIVGFVLIGLSPTDEAGDPTGWLSSLGAVLMMSVMLVASLLLFGLRREVYRPSSTAAPLPATPPSGNQGAMATVEQARRRRDEARKLAATDPMMARELGIGRPDVELGYDDGGLLDLNTATPAQLSTVCGLPPAVAHEVVTARSSLGRFLVVEDAIVYGQVGEEHAPTLRDRGLVITDL